MSTLIIVVLFIWILVISRVTYKLSVQVSKNESNIKKTELNIRGITLAVRMIHKKQSN